MAVNSLRELCRFCQGLRQCTLTQPMEDIIMESPPTLLRLSKASINCTCSVGDGDILFEVHTGVRQGCVMSTLLLNLVVDWIMLRTTED